MGSTLRLCSWHETGRALFHAITWLKRNSQRRKRVRKVVFVLSKLFVHQTEAAQAIFTGELFSGGHHGSGKQDRGRASDL